MQPPTSSPALSSTISSKILVKLFDSKLKVNSDSMEFRGVKNFTYQKKDMCRIFLILDIMNKIRNPSHTYVDYYIDKIPPTSTKIILNLTEMNELGSNEFFRWKKFERLITLDLIQKKIVASIYFPKFIFSVRVSTLAKKD